MEKDKVRKEEEKTAIYLVILEAVLVLALLFGSLNPCGIIGSSHDSFYKMLFSFAPYSIEGANMGTVNALLLAAMLLILISMIVYVVFAVMVLRNVNNIGRSRFGYLAATCAQLLSLVLIIAAKTAAAGKSAVTSTAFSSGFWVYLIFFLIGAWFALKYFEDAVKGFFGALIGFFKNFSKTGYAIVALVCIGVIVLFSVIPGTNAIRFSSYQNSESLFASVFGGFANYVIELARAVLPDGNTYSAFSFTSGGFQGSYELLSGWTFKLVYYSSVVLLIALAATLLGLILSFIKSRAGSIIAFAGGLVSFLTGVVLCVGAKCLTTHTKGYYLMFKTEGLKEVDYFPVKTPASLILVMILLTVMFFAVTVKAAPVIKAAAEKTGVKFAGWKSGMSVVGIVAASAALIAFAFVPGLNILNVSGKLPKQSLVAALGDWKGFYSVFKTGIEKQFYQKSMVSLLWGSGLLLLIGAAVCVLSELLLGAVLKEKKLSKAVTGCGVVFSAAAVLLNLVTYNKISAFSSEMYTDTTIGTTIADYRDFLQMSVPAGLIAAAAVLAVLAFAYGMYVSGNVSVMFARMSAVLVVLFAFIPGLNPGRISDGVNKNKVLWGTALGYKSYIENLNSVTFSKALADERCYQLIYILALILFLASVALVVGFCMSFGELRFKRVSCVVMSAASFIGFAATAFMPFVCKMNEAALDLSKNTPMRPLGIYIYMLFLALCFIFSLSGVFRLPLPTEADVYEVKQNYKLFLMALPFIALVVVFSYLPLWGWRYSFYNYTPGTDLSFRDWVGLDWFKFLVQRQSQRQEIVRVLRNTLVMSGLGLCTQVLPVAFAIFISEIRRPWFKKIVQTVTTIPNFISWVLVYAIARALFESDGFINNIAISLGMYDEPKLFLQFSGFATCIWMLLFGVWKGLGWSAIVYIAAISGIDQQLYEAATVDGAGRFKRMWHITVPGLMPTFMVMFLMAIAGCLSNGMDQYYVFKTSSNKEWIEVLDYYVYRLGLGDGSVALATIIGMLKSVVSVVLLFIANGVSKLVRGESIV